MAMDAACNPSSFGFICEANRLEEPGASSDDCPSTTGTLPVQAEASNADTKPASCVAESNASSENFAHFENASKFRIRAEMEDDKKPEREHKKRSKNWTRPEILKLIHTRAELDEQFRKSGKKSTLWEEIAHSLQQASFSRDAQQCKDKWEKLTAGYKEVCDGARDKEDHPYFEELHQFLSWRVYKRDGPPGEVLESKRVKLDQYLPREDAHPYLGSVIPEEEGEPCSPRKPMKFSEGKMTHTDLTVIQELLETVLLWQQRFLMDLLNAMERKERIREQLRHEREDKWRAEDRAERYNFQNAMIVLVQRLLGESPGPLVTTTVPTTVPAHPEGLASAKKRSKNWKRSEVFHLIRLRKEMGIKFAQSSRRARLWDELGNKLMKLGVQRDGKQCREKWDKLMAEYKDVKDGKKGKEESLYFTELATILANDEGNDYTLQTLREEDERSMGSRV